MEDYYHPASDSGAHCEDHEEFVGTCAACADCDNIAFLAGE
jgi:hypothetical protein